MEGELTRTRSTFSVGGSRVSLMGSRTIIVMTVGVTTSCWEAS